MLFWTLIAALVVLVAALFVLALVRRQPEAAPTAAYDMQVYRDQLRDIEKDAARGVMGTEEAERAKLEVSRRMLEADREAKATEGATRPPKGALAVGLGLIALALGGSFFLYARLGAPGYQDMPMAERFAMADEIYNERPDQPTAEEQAAEARGPLPEPDAQFTDLMARLRQAVEDRPNDPRGLELLARNEAAMGNFRAGWETQQRLIDVKGDAASANDYASLGELKVIAAGGLVTQEAETAFATAMEKDPRNGLAMYYLGLMMAQNGRGDRAFDIWDTLLRLSTEDEPWVPMIRANIDDLAWLAGERNYTQPAAKGIPATLADIQAAARAPMPQAREMMLRDKLEALNAKMAGSGGPVGDWVVLISGLKLLGEEDRAAALFTEAQRHFETSPEAMDALQRAADGEIPGTDGLKGPTAEQMQDAAEMSDADRQEMILGMVNGLVDRLETEGGSGAEWARAVMSLSTLGQADRAADLYAKGKTALADDAAALAALEEAAQNAGLSQ
ncbi:c-type cytochrome biogenesis protein CcmI [Thioclava sp. A2]|uniref:c-type cytochrome biogenesis protein CcmI n=1 Tax=Thioclava sp. FCG-A2 TaxID=3080562 RepID=UPI002953109A|nr:c-type cytochrome biogenesis protein CcmI [Thioclava sp. A2]MDV7269456.1 c-type cytochrome biogenesis protein CcmI [Thioclava sp. A2]